MISNISRQKMGWKKGKIFTAYFKNCEVCGLKFKTVPTSTQQHCCSRKCSFIRKKKTRIKYECKNCGKDIYALKRKSGSRKYCSNTCKIYALAKSKKERFKNKGVWGQWGNYKEAKKWYKEIYKACQICGYSKNLNILELHHKDRNRKNNTRNNLMLVCPNCHSEEHFEKKDGQFKNNFGRYEKKE